MERFGVSEGRLPAGAQVINRPFSLWREYRWQILVVLALLGSETVLILVLLHIMRDRRKAIKALAQERASLEERGGRADERAQGSQRTTGPAHPDRQPDRAGQPPPLRRGHQDGIPAHEALRAPPLSARPAGCGPFQELQRRPTAMWRADDLPAPDRVPDQRHGQPLHGPGRANTAARSSPSSCRKPTPLARPVLAERIRQELADLCIPHAASAVADHVTASLGVVTVVASEPNTVQDVIALADEQALQGQVRGEESGGLPVRGRGAYAPVFGARSFWRDLQAYMETQVGEESGSGRQEDGQAVVVGVRDGRLVFDRADGPGEGKVGEGW